MGNVICLSNQISDPQNLLLSMSNGLTDVFINVLLLSGSQLAKDENEKRLIVWLAERDQSAVGMGTVGFSVLEMPWNITTFEKDQAFMLKAIEHARNGIGWKQLDYVPSEDLLFPALNQFYFLIAQLKRSDIKPDSLEEWLAEAAENDPVRCGFPRCSRHDTLLTTFGCQICNNEVLR